MSPSKIFILVLSLGLICSCNTDKSNEIPWHGLDRSIRYQPDGSDFVIQNGERRFNRALYGSNTGFRIEAGDLPEFALYLPGMGGNLKWGIADRGRDKWLIESDHITARYRPGSMIYEIRDSLLGEGRMKLHLLAVPGEEGLILRVEAMNLEEGIELYWAFGGATGKKFSRSGDIGADPESSFDLKPANCADNSFDMGEDSFILHFGNGRRILGRTPLECQMRICNARKQDSPRSLFESDTDAENLLSGRLSLQKNDSLYFMLLVASPDEPGTESELPAYDRSGLLFKQAEESRKSLAGRIQIHTPDAHINTLGGALSVAADAIWETPSYLHGAVAWRNRLAGWRGAYAADWLGWHDRARQHFSGYAKAQYTSPDSAPAAPDPETHLSRQVEKAGYSLFSKGYISRRPNQINRPHHYDMNLVFMDQLLWHLNWTGDLDFAREMWPVIRRHFDWEKRCFDTDRDGLYNAYCCIWASDALQYSGGGVTHSSAYNYRANRLTARLAAMIGEDPEPFRSEADKIRAAAEEQLWLPRRGWYAEYKDHLGLQLVHPTPGLWTIYHALDAGLADPFQAYQCLNYVDHEIPHIPMLVEGLPEGEHYSLSTSNWMPYTWSINNVALSENLHTCLVYWLGGRKEEAFRLWKSQLLESMYTGASPGNFQQLSFYDAFRGELYRDFADPVGMAARTLVEGLFGIRPDALDNTLTIRPGFPEMWDSASMSIPGLSFSFRRQGREDCYSLVQGLPVEMDLLLQLEAQGSQVESCSVNGKDASWNILKESVGRPVIQIQAACEDSLKIHIIWAGPRPGFPDHMGHIASGDKAEADFGSALISEIYDPQGAAGQEETGDHSIAFRATGIPGNRTLFVKLLQDEMEWWQPVVFEVRDAIDFISGGLQKDELLVTLENNCQKQLTGTLSVNGISLKRRINLAAGSSTGIRIPLDSCLPGSNLIGLQTADTLYKGTVIEWDIQAGKELSWHIPDLGNAYNDRVDQIFRNEYLSPRAQSPTLQIPIQGIGDWCTYRRLPVIDDSGLRARAGAEGHIMLKQGIPLRTPGETDAPNIIYTSRWDNYPCEIRIPLSGKAQHAYFLMAGSVHHMQSRMCNGMIRMEYSDGTADSLSLDHPESWWPIEQDYYEDGYAFHVGSPKPPRILLKSGEQQQGDYQVLKKNGTNDIDGGAATLYDLPLDPSKELRSLHLETRANDVVIGLMGISLVSAGDATY